MKPIEVVLLGAGSRGTFAYGRYAKMNPHMVRFVAVAEPNPKRRERFAREHNIPPERCFESWEELLAQPQLAEALLNATMDQTHLASTLAALERGYHVLLEKPMATTPEDCVRLVQAAERTGRILQICHVMRYTKYWGTLHDILRSGRLGRIITVEHRENVAYWHMAHSFVRGNWRNSKTSAPMILAKCCHDMDILYWNLGVPVRRLSSFGSLLHFRPEHAPEGAPERCTDGCPAQDECPFYAPRLYLGENTGWPVNVIATDLSMEGRLKALREGPYGRCVYHCDNDVVDHQVVNMELEDGTSVTFTMHGHSHNNVRTTRYDGTRATLRASEATGEITIYDHLTGGEEVIVPGREAGGHGGGDTGVMNAFVAAVRGKEREPLTSARASLESHLMAFAAEKARVEGTIIDMAAYRVEVEARALSRPLDL
ncbi:MAG: Gfo/Idh/MocA family oxidoreductase [Anaerolineae bacterium]|nr:Gfo/Idh/MocA family oxidoreductase [Anaerolineae bacterium]